MSDPYSGLRFIVVIAITITNASGCDDGEVNRARPHVELPVCSIPDDDPARDIYLQDCHTSRECPKGFNCIYDRCIFEGWHFKNRSALVDGFWVSRFDVWIEDDEIYASLPPEFDSLHCVSFECFPRFVARGAAEMHRREIVNYDVCAMEHKIFYPPIAMPLSTQWFTPVEHALPPQEARCEADEPLDITGKPYGSGYWFGCWTTDAFGVSRASQLLKLTADQINAEINPMITQWPKDRCGFGDDDRAYNDRVNDDGDVTVADRGHRCWTSRTESSIGLCKDSLCYDYCGGYIGLVYVPDPNPQGSLWSTAAPPCPSRRFDLDQGVSRAMEEQDVACIYDSSVDLIGTCSFPSEMVAGRIHAISPDGSSSSIEGEVRVGMVDGNAEVSWDLAAVDGLWGIPEKFIRPGLLVEFLPEFDEPPIAATRYRLPPLDPSDKYLLDVDLFPANACGSADPHVRLLSSHNPWGGARELTFFYDSDDWDAPVPTELELTPEVHWTASPICVNLVSGKLRAAWNAEWLGDVPHEAIEFTRQGSFDPLPHDGGGLAVETSEPVTPGTYRLSVRSPNITGALTVDLEVVW